MGTGVADNTSINLTSIYWIYQLGVSPTALARTSVCVRICTIAARYPARWPCLAGSSEMGAQGIISSVDDVGLVCLGHCRRSRSRCSLVQQSSLPARMLKSVADLSGLLVTVLGTVWAWLYSKYGVRVCSSGYVPFSKPYIGWSSCSRRDGIEST